MKDEIWDHVAIIGAAGKMGSGIALLILEQIAYIPTAILTLIDMDFKQFIPLKIYLKKNLKKIAERNINTLRDYYALHLDLIDNEEIIHAFLNQAFDRICFATSYEECKNATLVFEAIFEDIEIKTSALRQIATFSPKTIFLTNTSSIPIKVLKEKCGIEIPLIGFHFYNPPAIQKLVEIIFTEETDEKLKELASNLAKKLKKTVVFANDIAGFIGNGHFIREIQSSCQMVKELESLMTLPEAVFNVDRMIQKFLVRPMGIFQLIDYVGIDICSDIQKIMSTYLQSGPFTDPLITAFENSGLKGGVLADGTQKDGIFRYINNQPIEVYNFKTKDYISCSDEKLGPLPSGYHPWKVLSKHSERKQVLKTYFHHLFQDSTLGAELSRSFLKKSRGIAHLLVDSKVANSIEDVNTVLETGFFHLYGVEDPFG